MFNSACRVSTKGLGASVVGLLPKRRLYQYGEVPISEIACLRDNMDANAVSGNFRVAGQGGATQERGLSRDDGL
jgi:hypothetical protein